MKLIVEECFISNHGVSCIKPTFNKPSFIVNMLNNNVKFISKILTNEYIYGYICFRGCEFVIKDFLQNKNDVLNMVNSNNYSYVFN